MTDQKITKASERLSDERLAEIFDVGNQSPAGAHRGMPVPMQKCWRCLRHEPRIKDNPESVCEGCYYWMIGETDEDPKDAPYGPGYDREGAAMVIEVMSEYFEGWDAAALRDWA